MSAASLERWKPPTCRAGFTLIELLVVIAIISLLAAMFLPAMSRGLQTARSATCINNQRQIYLAYQLHVDSKDGELPGGGHPSADSSGAPQERGKDEDGNQKWGAFYQIQRYLGQGPDHDPSDTFIAEQDIPVYHCPNQITGRIRNPDSRWGDRYSMGYAMNCGPYLYGHLRKPSGKNIYEVEPEDGPGQSNIPHAGVIERTDRRPIRKGFFFQQRLLSSDIKDSSQTALFGCKRESRVPRAPNDRNFAGWVGGWVVDSSDDNKNQSPPVMSDTISSFRFPPLPHAQNERVYDGYGAVHLDAVIMTFADGHSQSIAKDIDLDTWRNLSKRVKPGSQKASD